jgi:hypothetical protein
MKRRGSAKPVCESTWRGSHWVLDGKTANGMIFFES